MSTVNPRDELFRNMMRHQRVVAIELATRFRVMEAWEIAPGVIVVQDDCNHFAIYYMNNMYEILDTNRYEDLGPYISPQFSPGVMGFILDLNATSFRNITATARKALGSPGTNSHIGWYHKSNWVDCMPPSS
jgi:hypothetical protein